MPRLMMPSEHAASWQKVRESGLRIKDIEAQQKAMSSQGGGTLAGFYKQQAVAKAEEKSQAMFKRLWDTGIKIGLDAGDPEASNAFFQKSYQHMLTTPLGKAIRSIYPTAADLPRIKDFAKDKALNFNRTLTQDEDGFKKGDRVNTTTDIYGNVANNRAASPEKLIPIPSSTRMVDPYSGKVKTTAIPKEFQPRAGKLVTQKDPDPESTTGWMTTDTESKTVWKNTEAPSSVELGAARKAKIALDKQRKKNIDEFGAPTKLEGIKVKAGIIKTMREAAIKTITLKSLKETGFKSRKEMFDTGVKLISAVRKTEEFEYLKYKTNSELAMDWIRFVKEEKESGYDKKQDEFTNTLKYVEFLRKRDKDVRASGIAAAGVSQKNRTINLAEAKEKARIREKEESTAAKREEAKKEAERQVTKQNLELATKASQFSKDYVMPGGRKIPFKVSMGIMKNAAKTGVVPEGLAPASKSTGGQPEAYTLAPGAKRFSSENKVVAEVPYRDKANRENTFEINLDELSKLQDKRDSVGLTTSEETTLKARLNKAKVDGKKYDVEALSFKSLFNDYKDAMQDEEEEAANPLISFIPMMEKELKKRMEIPEGAIAPDTAEEASQPISTKGNRSLLNYVESFLKGTME